MLWIDPGVARGVLKRLAAYQAKTTDPEADAQPGKILHEMRSGEMAALHEIPLDATMAASIRPRFSCCSPVFISNARATPRRLRSFGL